MIALDQIPLVFREDDEFSDLTNSKGTKHKEFLRVRGDINNACSEFGRLEPDHGNVYGRDEREDEPCCFYLVDDWLNSNRWQRLKLMHPAVATREWFDAMRRVLDKHKLWALSISVTESGCILLFPETIYAYGESFRNCRTFDELLHRIREWLEIDSLLAKPDDDILARAVPYLRNKTTLKLSESKVTDRGLVVLATQTQLTSLDLDSTVVTDSGLEQIRNLVYLDWLCLNDTCVTDVCLKHFTEMEMLEHLWLRNTRVAGSGFAHLKHLPALSSVYLEGCPVNEAGLAAIAMLPALETLEVGGPGVTNDGLKRIAKLPVKELFLPQADIDGNGIRLLKSCPNLKLLHLGESPIRDEDIPAILELPYLDEIDLYGTRVTDACLPILERSKTLTSVGVYDTAITDEGRNRILTIMGKRRGH